MKPQSAKAKGRNFQKQIRDAILLSFPELEPDDVRSTSMGNSGEDIQLSPAARKLIPFSIECKNVEKLNIWTAFEQAESANRTYPAALFIKKNRTKPLCVIDADVFFELLEELHDKKS